MTRRVSTAVIEGCGRLHYRRIHRLPGRPRCLLGCSLTPFSTGSSARAATFAQAEFDMSAETRERLGPGAGVYDTALARCEIDFWLGWSCAKPCHW